MNTQTIILIGLFFCHFLADFTHFSTPSMLNAKRLGKPLLPILCHAMVHGMLMGLFLCVMNVPCTPILICLQVVTHFGIDVWKGRMNGWFPLLQNSANKWHWVLFGGDQFLHAIVIVIMSSLAISL